MRLLQNHHFDDFDPSFIHIEWNSITLTPSVVCFTPKSDADNDHQFVVIPPGNTSISGKIKCMFLHV